MGGRVKKGLPALAVGLACGAILCGCNVSALRAYIESTGTLLRSVGSCENIMDSDPPAMAHATVAQSEYVYICADDGLRVIDVTDKKNPYLAATISATTLGFYPGSIAASGGYAYIGAGGQPGIYVFDLSSPTAPLQRGSVANTWGGVAAQWPYVYSSISNNFVVIDATNPDAPVVAGTVALDSMKKIVVDGQYAYVKTAGALHIIDVSVPTTPVKIGLYIPAIRLDDTDWAASGSLAYLGCYTKGPPVQARFEIVDFSTPASPALLSSLDLGTQRIRPRFCIPGYCVAEIEDQGLGLVDVSSPSGPVVLDYEGFNALGAGNGGQIGSIILNGDYIYAQNYMRFWVIPVSAVQP